MQLVNWQRLISDMQALVEHGDMKAIVEGEGTWDEKREEVEARLQEAGGAEALALFDRFCALNLDGAEEVLDEEEYQRILEDEREALTRVNGHSKVEGFPKVKKRTKR